MATGDSRHPASLIWFRCDEGILCGEDFPDTIPLFHNVFQMTPQHLRVRRAPRRRLAETRDLQIEIDTHVIRAEHLDPAYLAECTTPLQNSGPDIHMLLYYRLLAI